MTQDRILALDLKEDEVKIVNNAFTAALKFKRACNLEAMNEAQVKEYIANKLAEKAKKEAKQQAKKVKKINKEVLEAVTVIFDYAVENGVSPVKLFEEVVAVKKEAFNANIDLQIEKLQATKLS